MSTAEQGQMADHPTGIEESCIYIKEERDLDLEAEYEQLEGFQSDVTNIKTEVVGFPEDSYPFISRIGESYVPVKKEQELDLSVEIGQLKGPRKRLETLYPASDPNLPQPEPSPRQSEPLFLPGPRNLTARGSSKNSSSRGLAKQKLCKPEDGASHKKKKARAKLPRLPKANIKKNKNSNLNQEIHSKRTSDPHQKSKKSKLCIANDSLKTINELLWESIRMRSGRSDEYYDKLFLMSLYSHVQNIPENKKLHAKAELLQVLAKYNDPHLGTTTPS